MQFSKKIIQQNKPILTICRGMQLANIALGGDLAQDIPTMVKTKLHHRGSEVGLSYYDIAHNVEISKNSMIYKILGKGEIGVNSAHHQALGKLGKNVIPVAKSEDGIIEAIELKNYPSFFLGVQWHPEFTATVSDKAVIDSFCRSVANS